MGTIISTKLKSEGKVIFEVLVDYEEAVQLRGHMDNIHFFSEDVTHSKTTIAARGKNGATKYFLIPRELRNNIRIDKDVKCQKIELKDRIFYIHMIDKF